MVSIWMHTRQNWMVWRRPREKERGSESALAKIVNQVHHGKSKLILLTSAAILFLSAIRRIVFFYYFKIATNCNSHYFNAIIFTYAHSMDFTFADSIFVFCQVMVHFNIQDYFLSRSSLFRSLARSVLLLAIQLHLQNDFASSAIFFSLSSVAL